MKKLLPVILLIIGAGGGVGAGLFLRPAPEPAEAPAEGEEMQAKAEKEPGEVTDKEKEKEKEGDAEEGAEAPEPEYVKMGNQFVVPIVTGDQVSAMVVMSLSVEVPAGGKGPVYEREPKLRDSFLQVLFNHANRGGFDGAFTSSDNMKALRMALREVAQRDMGDLVSDVLIQEIARQDY